MDHITRNWLSLTVTTDLRTYEDIEPFIKRPFFLLVAVDGPLRKRYERERQRQVCRLYVFITLMEPAHRHDHTKALSLDEFVDQHDLLLNGSPSPSLPSSSLARHPQTDFRRVMNLATVSICNNFPSLLSLHAYLDELNLLDEERLRPGWDTYFMVSLTSHGPAKTFRLSHPSHPIVQIA